MTSQFTGKFDPITGFLEEFYQANTSLLQSIKEQLSKEVYCPLKPFAGKEILLPLKVSSKLKECADIAIAKLESICERHSIDHWLIHVRRFPNKIFPFSQWIKYATLAIIKFSNWKSDTTLGNYAGEKEFSVISQITYEDLCDFYKIAVLANLINKIIGIRLWVSKGADLVITDNLTPTWRATQSVKLAVNAYERRRPRELLLQDEATPIEILKTSSINSITFLLQLKEGIPFYFPKNAFTLFLMNYMVSPVDPEKIRLTLRAYDDALIEEFGIDSDGIIQTLHSLSRHMIETIVNIKFELDSKNNRFNCESDLDNQTDFNCVKFLFDLCQRGYIRFPEGHFRKRLSEYGYYPVVTTTDIATKNVNQFFDKFMLTEETRNEIDILSLDPCPILYASPGGNCYIDLIMLTDFIGWLIKRGKKWLSSQHGDRFTLFMKRFIQEKTPHASIVASTKKVTTKNGEKAEIDLIVKYRDTLFLMECKAHAKSREFLLGNSTAISSRSSLISKDVCQAKRAAEIFKVYASEHSNELPEFKQIEWLVCAPAQEFLDPLDKYGMLSNDIPRVCTPEEIVKYMSE